MTVGTSGTGNGQFTNPQSAVVDANGNIWVIDSSNNNLQQFNSSGSFLAKFGSSGTGNSQFSNARGMTIH
jgi:hypothetical protein